MVLCAALCVRHLPDFTIVFPRKYDRDVSCHLSILVRYLWLRYIIPLGFAYEMGYWAGCFRTLLWGNVRSFKTATANHIISEP